MSHNLVIVESPAKAKLIKKFLGAEYTVKASMGHVRDLPDKKAEMTPAQQKKYSAMAIDIEDDFKPVYVIKANKKKVIDDLKEEMKGNPKVWIATDEDREGEAIGYHLMHLLEVDARQAHRIVFHEITKDAILESLKNPRKIDTNLFHAQQARRVLDRLVGYTLSPLLWKKIRYGLSAGRVQSVAVRLIVDREKEILAFNPEEFWKLKAFYTKPDFDAELSHINGKKITNKTPSSQGGGAPLRGAGEVCIASAKEMSKILKELEGKDHIVSAIDEKDAVSRPAPPFTTSTLQQEASRKLGFSVKQTMSVAQRLYEGNVKKSGFGGGFITYMRTDSVFLSEQAITQSRKVIESEYGKEYLPPEPRYYKTKSKGAQEAHEAIRPTRFDALPSEVEKFLDGTQFKLYSLIWKRALACQMEEAKLKKTTVTISVGSPVIAPAPSSGRSEATKQSPEQTFQPGQPNYLFQTSGQVIVFPGFMKAYTEGSDNPEEALSNKEKILPKLEVGQKLTLDHHETIESHYKSSPLPRGDGELREPEGSGTEATQSVSVSLRLPAGDVVAGGAPLSEVTKQSAEQEVNPKIPGLIPEQNFTKPPARYTEASLVKKMEALGIGRPSTYAPTISTIVARQYVEHTEDKKLKPTDTGTVVTDFLVEHFSNILDYDFTAEMEKELDEIAEGQREWVPMMREFYTPFAKAVKSKDKSVDKASVVTEKTDEKCLECKKKMEIKLGRFGKFLSCTGFPECRFAKPILKEGELPPPEPVKLDEKCPQCSEPLLQRQGRFGPFIGCSGYPKCKYIKVELKKIGVICPKCQNDLIEKTTRKKKLFYACAGYPACENAFWDKPQNETCPTCGDKQLLVKKILKSGIRVLCPECKWEKQ